MRAARHLQRYPVPLDPRGDFVAVLSLPLDLTEAEAEKLCAFIRTLPIPPSREATPRPEETT